MVKIAMIGAGGVARNHRIAWKQQKNVHAVGVADILREKATSAAADLGAEYATDDYMDLLSSTDVDAVDICTCLLYTSPSPRDRTRSRMPSSA